MNDSFAVYLESLKGLLNVTQVAELLGVHKDTIYRWVRTMELPAMNIGNTKTLLRFAPKDLAAWAREAPYCFRGPARAITDWMEEQAVRRGGPRFLLPPLPKVLEQINYDWLNAARSMKVAARPTISIFRLMDDFCESVKKLPLAEQRQLLEDIESGKVNSPTFTCEDAE